MPDLPSHLSKLVERAPDLPTAAAELADNATIALRFARDAPRWLREPVTANAADAQIRERLQACDRRFLTSAARTIYGNPRSPYLALLRSVGCEPGDLHALVGQEGLDGALGVLAARGVYLTLDELKGRSEVVRGSARFWFTRDQFDNHTIRAHYATYTGGTRGRPTRIGRTLGQVEYAAATTSAVLRAHALERPRTVIWQTAPVGWLLCLARIGLPATDWFHPIQPLPSRVRMAGALFRAVGRVSGVRFPTPRYADLRQPERMAGWLGDRRAEGRQIAMTTIASMATRTAIAANERGIALDHVAFIATSEPTTAVRRAHIEASGARAIVHYAAAEAPNLTYSCATPAAPDDVHLMTDCYATVERVRPATVGGPEVRALLISSLNPEAGTILLNAELGDYAHLEQRSCGCALDALGLRTHLSEIRSFEKLTGEGVTFARGSLERLLEEILPARFGGTSLDYQLVEEEAAAGATRVSLRVHPRVGPLHPDTVVACALDELRRGGLVDRHQADLWQVAGTLAVVREAPLATAVGKVMPLHLIRRRPDGERATPPS